MANSSADSDTRSMTEGQHSEQHESQTQQSQTQQPQAQAQLQPQPQLQPQVHPQPQPQMQPGYPFPPPYQGYLPPYQGYPNNYQYGPPPPPSPYYPPAQNYAVLGPPQRNHGYNLARVFLVMMIILFVGMSVMSLLTWVIYGSDIPIVYVESMSMTILNTTSIVLNSTWDANVTMKNPNHKFDVSYDFVEATLVYDDHLLDTYYVEPFNLGKNDKKTLNTKFGMPNASQVNIMGASWVKDIDNERQGSGVVTFDIRIIVNAVFMTDNHRSTSRTLKILCGDLEVAFPISTATIGNLIGGRKECLVMSN